MHVFRLSDFEGEDERVRSKGELKEHRLEKTKGCHLYAISRPGGSHLRMVSSSSSSSSSSSISSSSSKERERKKI